VIELKDIGLSLPSEKTCKSCGGIFRKEPRRNNKWWAKAKFCSYPCKGLSMRGKPRISKLTPDGIRRIKLKSIGRQSPLKGRIYKLVTRESIRDRLWTSFKYRQWRSDVFTRDNFTCQWCGDNTSGKLNADHKIPLSLLFQKYEITNYIQALECEPLFDINNGRTLCEKCHEKIHKID